MKPFIKTKTNRMKRTLRGSLDQHIDEAEVRPNHPLKDGLPHQAYAIAKDINDPATWYLCHHTKLVKRAVKGKIGYEHTVDWEAVAQSVQLISLRGIEGFRLAVDPEWILVAAKHLASHYQKAGKPLPDSLAVLV